MPIPARLLVLSALLLGSCASNAQIAEPGSDHVRIEPLGYSDKPMPRIILAVDEAPEPLSGTLEWARQLSRHRIVVSSQRLDQASLLTRDACARDGTQVEEDFGDVGVSARSSRRGSFHCRLGPASACAYLSDLKDRNPDVAAVLDAVRDMRLRLGCVRPGDPDAPVPALAGVRPG